MKQLVAMESKDITYSIRRSKRAKRLRLAVYHDGSVVVTSPHYITECAIQKFIHLQSAWIQRKLELFSGLKIHPDIATHAKAHFMKHKEQALNLVMGKVRYYSERHGFSPNTLRVKRLKTKWGSCSAKKNLNFNYKILFLSEEIQDYLIVHELCHLREMNHSVRFWKQVGRIIPNYKVLQKALRSSGM